MKVNFACLLILVVTMAFLSTHAFASPLIFNLDPFTGDPADAIVTVDDNTLGLFRVNVTVTPEVPSSNIGDITGVFFNLSDQVTLSNIASVIGGSIIGFGTNTNDLGGGVNLTGGGASNPGSFDVGLRYAGFSTDDVQEVEFTIDRTDPDLDELVLEDFTGFGLRLQTVGVPGTSRTGSSKMSGFEGEIPPTTTVIPEPATVMLLGTGLLSLVPFSRRRNR